LDKNSSFIFRALELSVGKKIKCAVCVVGFLVQMFMVSSVSALLTTVSYKSSSGFNALTLQIARYLIKC